MMHNTFLRVTELFIDEQRNWAVSIEDIRPYGLLLHVLNSRTVVWLFRYLT